MYRFINTNPNKREFFYSRSKTDPDPNVWQLNGIEFYVYPDSSTPGTVPLHLYHDSVKTNHYFISTTPPPIAGMIHDSSIWGWVHATNPLVPARPSFLTWRGSNCQLAWLDNSRDETGFRIEKRTSSGAPWTTVTTVGSNVTSLADCTLINSSLGSTNYRVFAFNNAGDSLSSNEIFQTRVKRCRGCIWINADTATGDPPAESDDPSVSITSPVNGAIVGKDLVISADVFDIDGNGSIAKVEFFDGVKLGELTGPPPYNFVWKNAANGPHTLTVVVTDGSGMTATSAPVHITISAVPSVALVSPASDTVVSAPGSVTLEATASDADGSVAKVEFFHGEVKLGEDITSPYSFVWNNIQSGIYVITARVTDNVGLTATSAPTVLTVNSAPSVTLIAPTSGQVLPAPADVLLIADVADTDGTISKVDFYQGSSLIGTTTTVPFAFNWTNIPYGNYSVTAKATDNRNVVTTSAAVNVIVNSAPSVSITLPTPKAIFNPPATITIGASASDADGTISNVEFYQGATLIGTDTEAPFTVTWNNVAPGSYLLTARATDNRGAKTTSAIVPVTTPTFYDDFNDNSLALSKWHIRDTGAQAVVSEQGQQFRITLPANTATYNGIGSNALYDMRGGTAQVELVQAVSQAGWVENFLILQLDLENYFMIQTGAGNLLLRARTNGSNDQLIVPYDAVAHRYWRIRHNVSTNAVNFETSSDGATWTTRKAVTAGFAVTALRFVLLAGAWGTGNAAPGAAIYNDFQYIPDPSLPGMPAPILSDDFNDNSLDTTKWIIDNLFSGFTNLNVPMNETAQRLEIGPLLQNVNGSSYRGVRTVSSYNFTGAYSYVELVQAPSAATSADAMFTVGKDVNYYYRIYVNAGNLIGQRKVDGIKTTLFTIPYDPVNHRFLRIRHDSVTGSVTLDTAANTGGSPGPWVQRYSETWNASISLTAIILEVKGGTWQIEANPPGKVIFDNFVLGAQ